MLLARQLIEACMQPEPRCRPTAREALGHAWLQHSSGAAWPVWPPADEEERSAGPQQRVSITAKLKVLPCALAAV
eukprot:3488058-Prymnesium_polylepis.1